MSSWSGDSDYPVKVKMTGANQWNVQITKIDQNLNKIKQLLESTNRDFQVAKHKHTDIKNLESARENLGVSFRQLDKEIIDLERIISSESSQNMTAQKIKIKQIRSQAADATKKFRDLCTNINAELKNREMQRKKEISITSHEFDFNQENMYHREQMSVEMSLLEEADEDQRQIDKISKDIIEMEELFVKLSNMVYEQGAQVDAIESNVEEAYNQMEAGEKELDKAVDYNRSAMKKKICIIGIVAAVLCVLALIIGLAVGFGK